MTYGSVCSGIEAAFVAWHQLGWKASFLSEIEPFPCKVLKYRYPDVPLHGDFTTIESGDYEPIRLLVGGTPCQSFSIAGLRGGLDDDRGNLALEFCRLADRLRPQWLVWENVPGVLSSNGGRDFGSIIGALAELGYGLSWRVLDAQYAGVPQRRRRVFVVGYFGDWRPAAAVLFERHSLSWNTPPSREAREETTTGSGDGLTLDCGDVAGTLGAHHTGGWPPRTEGHGAFIPEVAHTLGDNSKGGANDMARLGALIATYVPDVSPTVTSKWAKGSGGPAGDECQNPIAFTSKDYGGDASSISPTLRSMNFDKSHANGGGQVAIAICSKQQGMGISEEVAGTLGSNDYKEPQVVCINCRVRRLTPMECERLQGFPDGYTAIPGAKDGPRYAAIGNSMAVPVMRWIGERIERVDKLIESFNEHGRD